MKNLTKLGTLLVACSCALTLCACSAGSSSSDNAHNNNTEVQEQKVPLSLDGKWKQTNSSSEDAYMEATIQGDVISVNWVTDGGKTESIYWIGTYPQPNTTDDSYSFTSTKDQEKTASAFLSSSDDTKDFTYSKGVLSYKVSMMGTTTTVELARE